MSATRFHLACLIALLVSFPATLLAENPNNFKWLTNYELASTLARKQDKLILAYFSGSDWDPWTDKIEKDVLSTQMFKDWAKANVIPLQVDSPQDTRRMSGITRQQNEKLKLRYNISKVPIFMFLDPSGQPVTRASYDELKLHDEEVKGEPKLAIAYLESVIKNRPPPEPLKGHGNLVDALAYAKKNYAVMLIAVTQGNAATIIQQRDDLLKDQSFVRFVNRNVVFCQMDWPEDIDTSPSAVAFRKIADEFKLTPTPFEFIIYDVPYHQVKAKIRSFALNHVDELIKAIGIQLPHIDYTGNWITDYNDARTIAAQHDRYVFLAFVSMDGGPFSKIMDDEIFKSQEFLDYAHKNLVLLRLDYPTAATQPVALATQNKMLAENFNVPGFPYVVVVNPLGQKLLQSKYLKGGPQVFMKQMEKIIANDQDRLAVLREKD
jgi:thioredoxin-related protein